ncbi:hypothetical protein X761_29145 [Mesorhizobium sp. LSHC424B00]|nr:hypothetical protein X761_29145 [Mesorhizobium sp. LSHC424B00]
MIFLSKVLERSMAQLLLAAQVLHSSDDAGLNPLCRRPLHPLRCRPGVLLDALP